MPSFDFEGYRIAYSTYGEGDRVLVLAHGLLMNQTMFQRLAPTLAGHGNRVVTVDLLGHGLSDQPHEMYAYSMTQFGRQVIALLDHLGVEQGVVGGTSLGANVALEAAAEAPDRVRGLFVEMPVLENALLVAALLFTPLAVSIRFGRPWMRALAWSTRQIPRSFFLGDLVLDWLRRDPEPSEAVLLGLLSGRTAPPRDERVGFGMPALIIGHRNDPLHPFSDADTLTRELPGARLLNANSVLEWRIRPSRLDSELAAFLDEVWAGAEDRSDGRRRAERPASASQADGDRGRPATR